MDETQKQESQAKRKPLHQEPDEEILLLGLMIEDLDIMAGMLRGLAYQREDYRGSLRVARGAAERFKARCTRLIGDKE